MATYTKLGSGNWRVQVRRKRRYISETFRRRKDAEEWALDIERRIDRGEEPSALKRSEIKLFADLVDLHIVDMQEVGRPPLRSKAAVLEALKSELGSVRIGGLSRERLIDYGRKRAKSGAGPATLAIDFSFLRTILTHAAAVHGIEVCAENVRLARVALTRLSLIGRAAERDRRPLETELERLIGFFEGNQRQLIPVGRIIRLAVATAMRQAEICSLHWDDVNLKQKIATIRDRKDPRRKQGNHHRLPLINLTGYDAWQLLLEQKILTRGKGLVFPHNSRSGGTAFRRGCRELGIKDLHFHDLRHEATSRLFEAGLTIERVALVTGHRDWRMLSRYTNLKPEDLLAMQQKAQVSEEGHLKELIG